MKLRIATMFFTVMLPVAAAAQSLSPPALVEAQKPMFDRLLSLEANSEDGSGASQVVPLWASPDGRLLAIVAMSNRSGAPALPPTPAFGGVSDLRVVDATRLFAAGLQMRLADGLQAGFALGQQTTPVYLNGDVSNCLVDNCFPTFASPSASRVHAASADVAWSPAFSPQVEFSLGLGWLRAESPLPRIGADQVLSSPIDLALLAAPQGSAYRLDSARNLHAAGSWALSPNSTFNLSAALSRAELSPIWYGLSGPEIDWNQISLGMGVSKGSIRGSIVGRINSLGGMEPGALEQRWGGIDLGVSWRTPWRGELTLGAQNLLSVPLAPAPDSDSDPSKARVPYVQYRQDL